MNGFAEILKNLAR